MCQQCKNDTPISSGVSERNFLSRGVCGGPENPRFDQAGWDMEGPQMAYGGSVANIHEPNVVFPVFC